MKIRSKLQRYGLAILTCVVALVAALPLDAPSSCFFLAVMVSNLYGGRGPGLLAVGLSALGFDYFFLPPKFQLIIEPSSYLRFGVFLGATLLITALIETKRRVEESRRHIDAQYRTIANTAPDAIISIDGDSRILFMNPAATRIVGWTPSELIGQPLTTLLPAFRLAGRVSGVELIGRRKNGTEFPAEASFGEVPGRNQSSYTGFVRDISERKRAEAALQKSESYLAEAQRLSKTGSFGWNTATGEFFWSRETFRIAEYDPTVRPSRELLVERIHPEDRSRVEEIIDQASRSGGELDFEYRLLMPDGAVKHVHALAHAVNGDSGDLQYVGAVRDITAKVNGEEKLRRSQAYLLEAERLSHTGSWGWDVLRNRPSYWSAEMCRIHGCDPSQGPPPIEDYMAMHSDEDWASLKEATQTSMRKRIDIDYDSRLLFPDGSVKHIHVVGHPLTNSGGEVIEIIGTTIDVTEQHQARMALQKAFGEVQKSEDRLRLIIDTIPTLAWCALPDGSAEFLSKRWLDFTGLSAEQAQNWGWTTAIHPEDLPAFVDGWLAILSSGKPGEQEGRLRRFDGEYRWFLFRAEPLRDEQGTIIRWYGSNTEIEDRKRAEEKIRASEHNLRLIVNSIPGLVSTSTPTGEFELVNQPILDYTGYAIEDLKDWSNAVHPDDLNHVASSWNYAVQTGSPFDCEFRVRRADGVYRWFHARGLPLRNTEGRIVRWYSLLTDIEDRKNAEEALRRTQARLARASQIATVGEMSASIAHEVNQPLSAVVANGHACLRWLMARPPNLTKALEAAERIVRDGKEAGEVVHRIRALFKRVSVEKAALDLNEVIGEVILLLRGETSRRRVGVETDLEKDLPFVVGDRVQLQQVILNLLLNGLEAMDPVLDRPRKIFIRSTRHSHEAVLVEIKDHGVGLEDPDRVFESFFTTKPNGMGMGLAICRSVIEAHNGRLWSASGQAPGATFCFTLPCNSVPLNSGTKP
jgi:PAS domain S-box-containing protein